MGITIHYSGRARDREALLKLIDVAQLFAAEREWMFAMFDDPLGVEEEARDAGVVFFEHDGPIRGLVIRPHPRSEPVRLCFDAGDHVSGSTKTQFAPFEIHQQVVQLLRAVEPFMAEFMVLDDSGLWESGDAATARQTFDQLGAAIGSLGDELREAGVDVEGRGLEIDTCGDENDELEP